MKITRIRAYQVDLPLCEGSYTWSGGTAVNILAREAKVTWEYRALPDRARDRPKRPRASTRDRVKAAARFPPAQTNPSGRECK